MSNESLELRPVSGNSLKEVMALGAIFKASGYFKDIRDEAQAVTKILYGREMGFTPIVSIMGIYIIEGKPSLSANLLATLVKRSGKYDYRVKENTATRCAILFRVRNDSGQWEDLGETEFTIDDAKTASVAGKDNWKKYPKAMLFARALSAGVRTHCPDVTVCPLYVPEELGANTTEDGEPIGELPKQPPPPTAATVEPRTFTKPSAGSDNGQGVPPQKGNLEPEPAKTADTNATARTTEPQESNKAVSKQHSTADSNSGSVRQSSGPEAAPSPKESASTTQQQGTASVDSPEPPADKVLPGCIGKGEAVNFAREFKANLRKDIQKLATRLEHEWLEKQGIVADGKPTAYAIKKENFFDVRQAAVEHARSL